MLQGEVAWTSIELFVHYAFTQGFVWVKIVLEYN